MCYPRRCCLQRVLLVGSRADSSVILRQSIVYPPLISRIIAFHVFRIHEEIDDFQLRLQAIFLGVFAREDFVLSIHRKWLHGDVLGTLTQ